MNNEQVNKIIDQSINLIEEEINLLITKQKTEPLNKLDSDKVIDYLKTLVLVSRDSRIATKEKEVDIKTMTTEEIDAAILEAANKIKDKNGT
jgi:uncharacterized coiled-coil DUF342 family protein